MDEKFPNIQLLVGIAFDKASRFYDGVKVMRVLRSYFLLISIEINSSRLMRVLDRGQVVIA